MNLPEGRKAIIATQHLAPRLLAGLTDQQRYVLDRRWGLLVTPPQTQCAIGAALGLRPARVRELEVGSIRHLEKMRQPANGWTLAGGALSDLARYGPFVVPGPLPARGDCPHVALEWIAWLQWHLAAGQMVDAAAVSEVAALYDGLLAGHFGPRAVVALLCRGTGHPSAAALTVAYLRSAAAAQHPRSGWIQLTANIWQREPILAGTLVLEVWQAAGPRSGYTIVIQPRYVPAGKRPPATLARALGSLAEVLAQAEAILERCLGQPARNFVRLPSS